MDLNYQVLTFTAEQATGLAVVNRLLHNKRRSLPHHLFLARQLCKRQPVSENVVKVELELVQEG